MFFTSNIETLCSELHRQKGSNLILFLCKIKDHPLATHREPCALEGWSVEIIYCGPKGRRDFLRILFTQVRGVCLCREHSKPIGPGIQNL